MAARWFYIIKQNARLKDEGGKREMRFDQSSFHPGECLIIIWKWKNDERMIVCLFGTGIDPIDTTDGSTRPQLHFVFLFKM